MKYIGPRNISKSNQQIICIHMLKQTVQMGLYALTNSADETLTYADDML